MSMTVWRILLVILAITSGKANGATPVTESGGTDYDFRRLETASKAVRTGRFTDALAIVGDLLDRHPGFGQAYLYRAMVLIDTGRLAEAERDLDVVQSMHPDYAGALFYRATIDVRRRQPAAALAHLADASHLPTASLWKRNLRFDTEHTISYWYALQSVAQEMLGHDDAALDAFDKELTFETERPWYILSYHCYTAALVDLLPMADLTCSEAIKRQGHDTGDYDSLGFVDLKMKKWDAAIANYDASLRSRPDLTLSLYGRGIARRAKGDLANGDADIRLATAAEPDIAHIMSRLGITSR